MTRAATRNSKTGNKRGLVILVVALWLVFAALAIYFIWASRGPGSDAESAAQGTTSSSSVALGAAVSDTSESDVGGQATFTATDTSYEDATKSITITRLSMGADTDTITYYVADVRLTEPTDLRAGLVDGGKGIADTSVIAADSDAILAVNGDYFGAREDGIVIRNGEIVRDKGVRTGLALYDDGRMEVFDETETSADELLDDGAWNVYSFGPALVLDGEIPENVGFYEVLENPKTPIQGRDPRTGIGLLGEKHFVLVVVDGRDRGYSMGVTMEEFAQIMLDLGCATAYNLDGGGSSTMWFMGEVVNQPSSEGEREISDILFIG